MEFIQQEETASEYSDISPLTLERELKKAQLELETSLCEHEIKALNTFILCGGKILNTKGDFTYEITNFIDFMTKKIDCGFEEEGFKNTIIKIISKLTTND